MAAGEHLRFGVEGEGEVSALLSRPANACRLLVLVHGAGAGMRHPFMEMLAAVLRINAVYTGRVLAAARI